MHTAYMVVLGQKIVTGVVRERQLSILIVALSRGVTQFILFYFLTWCLELVLRTVAAAHHASSIRQHTWLEASGNQELEQPTWHPTTFIRWPSRHDWFNSEAHAQITSRKAETKTRQYDAQHIQVIKFNLCRNLST